MAAALNTLLMLRESPKLQTFLDTALPLVALGTIADIMPLLDENRVLVAEGLRRMNTCPLPAVRTLLGNSGSAKADVDTMAWKICPLLNAPGRLGRTALTADFLLSREQDDNHDELFKLILASNRERRRLVDNELTRLGAELDGQNCLRCCMCSLRIFLRDWPDCLHPGWQTVSGVRCW
jgi:single-stranded DNA-specific DHH superfamily exonuclease